MSTTKEGAFLRFCVTLKIGASFYEGCVRCVVKQEGLGAGRLRAGQL